MVRARAIAFTNRVKVRVGFSDFVSLVSIILSIRFLFFCQLGSLSL